MRIVLSASAAVFAIFLLCTKSVTCSDSEAIPSETVRVFTVASERTEGYERYLRSAKYYGIDVTTLGLGEEWKGGDMNHPGGGYKINLLKEAVEPFKADNNSIILFTDSYDVMFASDLTEILRKFKTFKAKIVFGAEHFCWPDEALKKQYPIVVANSARFLNSGLFMGYASAIYELINIPIKNTDDDQLYYTKVFLDAEKRAHLEIKLDSKSELFQNLNGAKDDVKLDVDIDTGAGTLKNVHFETTPSVVHGNGPSKVALNAFANYMAGTFDGEECLVCNEGKIALNDDSLPIVTVAVFADTAVPFFEEFLKKIGNLNYPKSNINLFVHSNVELHDNQAKSFVSSIGKEYLTAKLIVSADGIGERNARKLAVQQSNQKKSDFLFAVDAEAHLDDPDVLRELLEHNKNFIAPVLKRHLDLWSNFWGALTENGFYARSHDYLGIVNENIRGIWNVPYVRSVYLVKKDVFSKMNFDNKDLDSDMSLCKNLRNSGVFMYVTNLKQYGHLINSEGFNADNFNPDFYTLDTNRRDWEQRYIHPEYFEQLHPNFTQIQPCTDVFWFKIATERFCDDLVGIVENFGKWSDGSNQDDRLKGGYEAVPTRDIHMNQVGLEQQWLKFLDLYVRPLQEAVFIGYFHSPPRSLMNFVVRYKPDEQPSLRPHHDSSTFTINIALNHAGTDYEGGGCKFLRYNCSVTDTRKGHMLMHPGRLTHFHEGLLTTKGTRYIMISFIDP